MAEEVPHTMLDRKRLSIAGALLVLALVAAVLATLLPSQISVQAPETPQEVLLSKAQFADREKRSLLLAGKPLSVEVVTSAASIELGLSGRSSIGSDGMLFILPLRQTPSFWMKEMQFDLDMVWIDGTKVVGVTRNVPAPDARTPLSELPLYRPPTPVTAVLELPAGVAEQLAIESGDTVTVLK